MSFLLAVGNDCPNFILNSDVLAEHQTYRCTQPQELYIVPPWNESLTPRLEMHFSSMKRGGYSLSNRAPPLRIPGRNTTYIHAALLLLVLFPHILTTHFCW